MYANFSTCIIIFFLYRLNLAGISNYHDSGNLNKGVAGPQMQFDSQHDRKNDNLQPPATSN